MELVRLGYGDERAFDRGDLLLGDGQRRQVESHGAREGGHRGQTLFAAPRRERHEIVGVGALRVFGTGGASVRYSGVRELAAFGRDRRWSEARPGGGGAARHGAGLLRGLRHGVTRRLTYQ